MRVTTLLAIRRRIRSVKNTQQITKAMEMVAGARLRKVERRMRVMRSYSEGLDRVLAAVLSVLDGDESPLIIERETIRKVCLVVMGADRGLCGAFNTNIVRYAEEFIAAKKMDFSIIPCGRKMVRYFRKRGYDIPTYAEELYRSLSTTLSYNLSRRVVEAFENQECDEVYILHPHFVNIMQHPIRVFRILPISLESIRKEVKERLGEEDKGILYELEPDAGTVCHYLFAQYIALTLFRCLLETLTSEMGARMTAMQMATENAQSVIDTLTIEYNQARQRSITRELIDIVGAVEALK